MGLGVIEDGGAADGRAGDCLDGDEIDDECLFHDALAGLLDSLRSAAARVAPGSVVGVFPSGSRSGLPKRARR
jgi:hypothetical protein